MPNGSHTNHIVETPVARPALLPLPSATQLVAFLRALGLRLPATVFVVHWLIVTVVAALSIQFAVSLPEVPTAGYRLPPLDGWGRAVVQPLRNWDGFWYGLIAEQGYGYHRATTAFWPLYPWTMALVAQTLSIPVELAGVILSNVAFFASLVVLRNLTVAEAGDAVSRRALWLIALFPTSFYFSAVYTESFFLLFSLLTFLWGRSGRWGMAGIAGLLAGLTRNTGGLLVLPLLVMAVARHGHDPRRWPRSTLALILPVVGSAFFLMYLWLVWGSPLLTFDIQANWGRAPAAPWSAFVMAWQQVRFDWLWMLVEAPAWSTVTSFDFRWAVSEHEALDVAVTLGVIPLLVYCFKRLPLAWGLWCAVVVAIPLLGPSAAHPLMSMPRYVLVLFPLFTALALLLRSRVAFGVTIATFALMLCGLTVQFSTWFWVA